MKTRFTLAAMLAPVLAAPVALAQAGSTPPEPSLTSIIHSWRSACRKGTPFDASARC
jgi:type IV secretory pathway VirB2 component (pilin)